MARSKATTPSPPSLLLLLLLLLFLCRSHAAPQPIRAVVVLIMENRSFDHMLGWMKSALGLPIDGLSGTECNRRSVADPASPSVCVSDDARYVDPDPGHSFVAVREQVFGSSNSSSGTAVPSMAGFVQQALSMSEDLAGTVMKGFKPENVPVYAALAQEFAVLDRWFSSLPGPTQPNRLFVYSATSHGATCHDKVQLAKGYPQKTIFDSLHDDGLDFGIYYESAPATLFYRNLRKLKYVFKFHKFGTFKDHARDGKLRSLSVLEPRYFDLLGKAANDDHPSHDVANGQKMVKEVYEALRASPQWNESLFIITYDEHGGFYDHVATPTVGVPSPDGIAGPAPYLFGFDRLGVRVPTILISPWIKKGTAHSQIAESASQLKALSAEVLPDVLPLRATKANEDRVVSEFQSEIIQMAAILNGDHHLTKPGDKTIKRMTVREADAYVSHAVARLFRASKDAIEKGADESMTVDMAAAKHG
ncbi:hypothetical protein BHM03_00062489 [Ensete ventricosum]|nr:hypothetical protein BHM03_00062489 [Ensete ventricosum]